MQKISFLHSLWLFALVFTALPLMAQVHTRRMPSGAALSGYGLLATHQNAPVLTLDPVDTAPLLAQDEQQAKQGYPYRFGVSRAVSIDVMQTASQTISGSNRVLQYRINAPGAQSLNLIFSQLRLAEGAKLYLYNPGKTIIIGPIEARHNLATGDYWTDLLEDSQLIIELHEPLTAPAPSQLALSSVIYGYRKTGKAFGNAGTCHPNMACYPDYQPQGDGVVLILLDNATRLCSGSVVNNTRQSFRSYILSAFHCVDLSSPFGMLDGGEIAQAQNWLIRFQYQSPTCTPSQEDNDVITLNGSTFRAGYANSDFALLELNQQLPDETNATFLGWNRDETTTGNNAAIHHPYGDVKKISFTNADTQVSGYDVFGTTGATDHLISFWGNLGATDPGSSGSPLLDGNRRVVGQLHGGPSYCGATGDALRDYYGRFFTSWTGGNAPDMRLSNWLDPNNTPQLTTDGAKPAVSGPASVAGSGTFSLNSGPATAVTWAIAGGSGVVTPVSGSGNTASLSALASGSSLTITFSINDGQAYPIQFSRAFAVDITTPTTTGFALTQPTYTCQTGAIAFNTTGGDGSAITYTAVGISRTALTNATGTVEPGLRADPKPLVIQATQSGIRATVVFDFAAFCSGNTSTPPTPPISSTTGCGSPASTFGQPLMLQTPVYECVTGQLTFITNGGNGSEVTYFGIGITAPTTNCRVRIDANNTDNNLYILQATQNGVTAVLPWVRPCSSLRQGADSETELTVIVQENPASGATLTADIRGADGQPLLLQLRDATGRLIDEQHCPRAGLLETKQLLLGSSAGLYLLRVSTPTQTKTVRVLRAR